MRSVPLSALDLSGLTCITASALHRMLQLCQFQPTLRYLSLRGSRLTAEHLNVLRDVLKVKGVTRVEHFDLGDMFFHARGYKLKMDASDKPFSSVHATLDKAVTRVVPPQTLEGFDDEGWKQMQRQKRILRPESSDGEWNQHRIGLSAINDVSEAFAQEKWGDASDDEDGDMVDSDSEAPNNGTDARQRVLSVAASADIARSACEATLSLLQAFDGTGVQKLTLASIPFGGSARFYMHETRTRYRDRWTPVGRTELDACLRRALTGSCAMHLRELYVPGHHVIDGEALLRLLQLLPSLEHLHCMGSRRL